MSPVRLLTGISGGIGQATAGARGTRRPGHRRGPNADRRRAAVQKIRDGDGGVGRAHDRELSDSTRCAGWPKRRASSTITSTTVKKCRCRGLPPGELLPMGTSDVRINRLAPDVDAAVVDRLGAPRPGRPGSCASPPRRIGRRAHPLGRSAVGAVLKRLLREQRRSWPTPVRARPPERLEPAAVVANAVSPGFVNTGLNCGVTLPYRFFFDSDGAVAMVAEGLC